MRAGQSHAFEKIKSKDKDGKEEEKWRQVSPQARDIDQAKVEALLSAITGAQATALAPPTAKAVLDKPELTAAIKYDEGRKEDRVIFARSGTTAFAVRGADNVPVAVATTTLDAIIKALEEIK